MCVCCVSFFFQAEDGIRYLVRSRGLGDVYKRQSLPRGQGGLRLDGGAAARAKGLEVGDGRVGPGPDLSLIHI